MEKQQVLTRIRDLGLVPVIRARSAEEAASAVEAIRAGGVDVLEVTMTVPAPSASSSSSSSVSPTR